LEVQAFVPNGVPRRTQWRIAAISFSVIGRFTRAEWKSRMTPFLLRKVVGYKDLWMLKANLQPNEQNLPIDEEVKVG